MVSVWINTVDRKRLDEISKLQFELELGRFFRFTITPSEYGLTNVWYNDIYAVNEDDVDTINNATDAILKRDIRFICLRSSLHKFVCNELKNKCRFISELGASSIDRSCATVKNYIEWILTGAILGSSYHGCTKRIEIRDDVVVCGDEAYEDDLVTSMNKILSSVNSGDKRLVNNLFEFLPIMTGTDIEMFLAERFGFDQFLDEVKQILLEYMSLADSDIVESEYHVHSIHYNILTILEALNG